MLNFDNLFCFSGTTKNCVILSREKFIRKNSDA